MELAFGFGLPWTSDIEFETILSYSQEAEKRGYDSIWIADHWFIPLEAFTTLTALAMRTTDIKLGTSVIDANRRAPAMLAHVTSTLDTISRGRLILGISSGIWNEKTFGFPLTNKVSRFREVVEILKKFWIEDEVNYKGQFFDFVGATIVSKPFQKPHPPIWINGFGPRMKKIAGELGDGFVTQHCSPDILKEEFNLVKDSAKKVGRDVGKLEAVFAAPFAIAKTYDEAIGYIRERARNTLRNYGGPPHNYAERMGYSAPWEKPEDVPDDAIDQCFIFGTPEDCIEKIKKFAQKGVSHFISLPLYPLGLNSIKMFAEEVISHFKK
jgi:alkanesulfonate monooxygenase SsuD/methylene tetrahydromethanopterin reductase-like flavin-dependent oxidoreductase (luciferase family)